MAIISIRDKEKTTYQKIKELKKMDTGNNPYHERSISYIALSLINSEKSLSSVYEEITKKRIKK